MSMIGASAQRAAAAGCLALVLVALGCAPATSESPAPVSASAASVAAGASPSSVAVRPAAGPALCGAPKPARVEPFPFNRDAYRRDTILGVSTYLGGTARFSGLDHEVLASLIEQRFVDPYDQQNLAPSAWEILQFLCQHQQVVAAGYVVSTDRPDYRTTIEAIYTEYTGGVDDALQGDAEKFCADADEVTFEGELECFWD
ncbi:hypothetical protein [Phytohabitans kaempferiae]|uniref:DUF732 domain-containing protein n=1 Tax=Phytohabitans kaempferiae TaxID=1620943 RepID=A0ABV6LY04_9ACTN